MSNVLKVNLQETIRQYDEKGWSARRIAKQLEINRRTVSRYIEKSKCTRAEKVTAGKIEGKWGEKESEERSFTTEKKEDPGAEGSVCIGRSQCEKDRGYISERLEAGLSAQRIYQDLVVERGYEGSYESVKRYVRKIKAKSPRRIWRMESLPGEEGQGDFGRGAPIEREGGKVQKTWVFRLILTYSRKGYSEVVLRQDCETFLRCMENALRSFGGSPLTLNLDNLKAAIIKADWYDPEINPKFAEFCRHYGITVIPCRARKPEHKGKVERGIGYVKENALKGRKFKSLAHQNAHLANWEKNVADKRIHGTTCKQVAVLFEEEKPHLQKLPDSLFPSYLEAMRKVGRDSFVEVQKAYYEVPPEYIGHQVWVRWDSRCVRIFNQKMEQLQMHNRVERGKFSRILGAYGLSVPVSQATSYWVYQARLLGGEACEKWAQLCVEQRGPEALRSIIGLCGLMKKHSAHLINIACEKAIKSGLRRLRDIKNLIQSPGLEQKDFTFMESHPLIRDLKTYSDFINTQTNQPNTKTQ